MAKQRTRLPGEGSIYVDQATGRWVGSINLGRIDGRRVRRKVTGKTAKEVQTKLRHLRREIEAGVIPDAASTERWIRHWLNEVAARKVREKTLYNYRRVCELHILPAIGSHRLSSLKPEHVRELHSAMRAKDLSDTTVRQAHAILQRALRVAMEEGRVSRNVAQIVGAPSPTGNHHASLTLDQARAVLAIAADARQRCRLFFAIVLGVRQSEALGLRWESVTHNDGKITIQIRETVQRVPGEGIVTAAPKTKSSFRTLIVDWDDGIEIIESWREASGGQGYVFGGLKGPGVPEGQRRDHQAWSRALEAAGVPHVPLHGARASAASLMRESGVSERTIADILGHSTVKITQDAYLRSGAEQRTAALSALGRQLSATPETDMAELRVKVPKATIARLDALAAEVEVSRSAFTAELLAQALDAIAEPAAPDEAS